MPIHFDTVPMDTAVYEQGGPLNHEITATGAGTRYGNKEGAHGHREAVPDSGNGGVSGLARDFHKRHFARKENESSQSSA